MRKEQNYRQIDITRFGYIVSAIFLVISNIALINEWPTIPIWFIITMYFLTGSLWAPKLIKPFYGLIGKYIIKESKDKDDITDSFNKN